MKVIKLSIHFVFLVIFTIGAAVLYYIALINIAVVVTTGQYSWVGALAGFTVDTTLYYVMHTVIDSMELCRPRLLTNKVALAVKIGKLIAREVVATVTSGL
jgi:hypothetical protein